MSHLVVRQSERGFTLIEMLVALAVMGMAAAMLLAGLKMPGQFGARFLSVQASQDKLIASQTLLRTLIETMRPLPRLDSYGTSIDIGGTERDIAFFAPQLGVRSPDQLQRYRLLLSATGDLTLYSANSLDDRIDLRSPRLKGWSARVLHRGVSQLSIAYYGVDSVSGRSLWQNRWNDQPQPPELVRIRVTFADDKERAWPDLIARPGATSNATCRIDRLSGRCSSN